MAERGQGAEHRASPASAERKARGDYPTPPWLVDTVVDGVLPALLATTDPVRVIDPACGDGRFLAAAADRLLATGRSVELHGVDVAAEAITAAEHRLRHFGDGVSVHLTVGDALATPPPGTFDVIVGNPPYLSQLARATTRGRASSRGGGPYADAAAEFVALAGELVSPGGVIGLVLPQSLLASRDTAAIRAGVDERCERVWSWWSAEHVFDAAVVVCALGLRRPPEGVAPAPPRPWTEVITTALGLPPLPGLTVDGTVGERLHCSVEFRDNFYALAGATVDDPRPEGGPALVTTGMIDPWTVAWGDVDVRVNKRTFRHPRVDLDALDERRRSWAAAQLVPKLLIANQSRVVEVVVDESGALLPSVPVLSARPKGSATESLWAQAAVLTGPVATLALWHAQAGTGLSGRAIRLTPAALAAVPWPAGDLGGAGEAAAAGAYDAAGRAVLTAYGLTDDTAARLLDWQRGWATRGAIRRKRGQTQPA